jgi:hypothetical protein
MAPTRNQQIVDQASKAKVDGIWTERYGCFRAPIGRIGKMEVVYEKEGYKVSSFGLVLKARFEDVEQAKAAAIKLAKTTMQKLLAEPPFNA